MSEREVSGRISDFGKKNLATQARCAF